MDLLASEIFGVIIVSVTLIWQEAVAARYHNSYRIGMELFKFDELAKIHPASKSLPNKSHIRGENFSKSSLMKQIRRGKVGKSACGSVIVLIDIGKEKCKSCTIHQISRNFTPPNFLMHSLPSTVIIANLTFCHQATLNLLLL